MMWWALLAMTMISDVSEQVFKAVKIDLISQNLNNFLAFS